MHLLILMREKPNKKKTLYVIKNITHITRFKQKKKILVSIHLLKLLRINNKLFFRSPLCTLNVTLFF